MKIIGQYKYVLNYKEKWKWNSRTWKIEKPKCERGEVGKKIGGGAKKERRIGRIVHVDIGGNRDLRLGFGGTKAAGIVSNEEGETVGKWLAEEYHIGIFSFLLLGAVVKTNWSFIHQPNLFPGGSGCTVSSPITIILFRKYLGAASVYIYLCASY